MLCALCIHDGYCSSRLSEHALTQTTCTKPDSVFLENVKNQIC